MLFLQQLKQNVKQKQNQTVQNTTKNSTQTKIIEKNKLNAIELLSTIMPCAVRTHITRTVICDVKNFNKYKTIKPLKCEYFKRGALGGG